MAFPVFSVLQSSVSIPLFRQSLRFLALPVYLGDQPNMACPSTFASSPATSPFESAIRKILN